MRYQTIDTTTGEIVSERSTHPLLDPLRTRRSAPKRRWAQKWAMSTLERDAALVGGFALGVVLVALI